eukprot:scaffold7.g3424.t1
MSFDGRRIERPDPAAFLRKHEGAPAGLNIIKLKAASPPASPTSGTIRAGSAQQTPGSPKSPKSPKRPASPGHRSTLFHKMYSRGDLPCVVDQARPGKNGIRFKANLLEIDLHFYLPVFFDGLLETQASDPCRMLACKGCEELLRGGGARVLPVLPQLIMPLKATLKSGEAARGQRRRLHGHVHDNVNIGDAIHYGQRLHRDSLGDLVADTLHTLERSGGPDAFLNIKYVIATYESCLARPAAAPPASVRG